jgi:hypothetical protein
LKQLTGAGYVEDVLDEHVDSLAWAAWDTWRWPLDRLAAALDLVAEVAVDAPA